MNTKLNLNNDLTDFLVEFRESKVYSLHSKITVCRVHFNMQKNGTSLTGN